MINSGTLQMLTNIENRLEELFEEIELLPQEKVEAAEKVSNLYIYNLFFLFINFPKGGKNNIFICKVTV